MTRLWKAAVGLANWLNGTGAPKERGRSALSKRDYALALDPLFR